MKTNTILVIATAVFTVLNVALCVVNHQQSAKTRAIINERKNKFGDVRADNDRVVTYPEKFIRGDGKECTHTVAYFTSNGRAGGYHVKHNYYGGGLKITYWEGDYNGNEQPPQVIYLSGAKPDPMFHCYEECKDEPPSDGE